jgi:amino acid transporter
MKDDSANIGSVVVGIVVFVVIMAMGLVIVQGVMNSTNITDGPMATAFQTIGPQTATILGLAWNIPLVLIAATVLAYLGYQLYQGPQ